MKQLFQFVTITMVLFSACSEAEIIMPGPGEDSLVIVEAFPQLEFVRPVDLQSKGDNLLFVVEQRGVIRVVINDPTTNESDVFLDLQSQVDNKDNEEGLLGLAFHPDFNQNGYFYINYTTSQSTTRVSRFEASLQEPVALPSSELILLEFNQPFGNHNGGQLAFGPDGYLYIAVGDGGSGGDPQGHGQNTNTLLGSILRIDVDSPSGSLNYSIPGNNPFAATPGSRGEIFAYGLRNPWRMSFDHETGQLWTGDVGQNTFEEINIIVNGGNYGWKIMEASDCFQSNNCDQSGLIQPYHYYNRDSGTSITGGILYRGSIASLNGRFIYADYNSGRIWALEAGSTNPENVLLFDTSHRITTFGVDSQQELYFGSIGGKIYKIEVD